MEETRIWSGVVSPGIKFPTGSDTRHLHSHSIGPKQSHDPLGAGQGDVGECTVQWTVAWQDRVHETSPGGTQEAVKNVSWRRGGGGDRTTATWATGHEGGG